MPILSTFNRPNAIVFALPGNEALAKSVAGSIKAEIGKTVIRQFPDGETYVQVLSDVRNKKAIVICTLAHPDEKLLPLYFLSKTLKSLGASSTCLVAPYLAYMRQDKVFKEGEGVTSEFFASLISEFADELITVDPHLHRRRSMSEIYLVPCEVIHASPLVSKYISEHITNPVLIGPDAESEQWVSEVAKNANAPFFVLEKTRLGDRDVRVTTPQFENFANYTPVLVDDIISTARTMIATVNHLKEVAQKRPVCVGVHGIFSGNAFRELLDAGASLVVTSNSIPHDSNQIDLTPLIAKSLQNT